MPAIVIMVLSVLAGVGAVILGWVAFKKGWFPLLLVAFLILIIFGVGGFRKGCYKWQEEKPARIRAQTVK